MGAPGCSGVEKSPPVPYRTVILPGHEAEAAKELLRVELWMYGGMQQTVAVESRLFKKQLQRNTPQG